MASSPDRSHAPPPLPHQGVDRALLDTLPLEAALLDAYGTVLHVNRLWLGSVGGEGAVAERPGYIDLLAAGGAMDDPETRVVIRGVGAVLEGREEEFVGGQAVEGMAGARRMTVRAARCGTDGPARVLVTRVPAEGAARADESLAGEHRGALRETTEPMRALVHCSPLAIIALDPAGRVTLWNPAADALFGWTQEEVLGQPLPLVDEQHAEEHLRLRERVLQGEGFTNVEVLRRRKDGSPVHLSISTAPLRGSDGAVYGIMSVSADITERMESQARLESYARELERRNRELQEFAYVASHDLHEPLRKVQAFGDRLRQKYAAELEGQGLDYLQRMQNAAGRMQELIQDLLSLSRVTTQGRGFEPVDLDAVARAVLADLDARIASTGASVVLDPLPVVEADGGQIRQLLQHLVCNALTFHRPDAAPTIRISGSELSGWVEIRVRDEGIGIAAQYHERIFQPFERLHGRSEYGGTGMGLAICRKIVERHGGTLHVDSAEGGGATFQVRLPSGRRTRA